MRNSKQETIEDIVAAMRNEGHAGDASCLEWVSAKFTSYANRIEAAAKREHEATREKTSQVGNAAKMREALVKAKKEICHHAKYVCQSLSWENSDIQSNCGDILCAHRDLCEAKTAINAALAAPPRNCDRPECATDKAAQDVWNKEDGGKTAYYEWLLATYTEGGTTDGKKN